MNMHKYFESDVKNGLIQKKRFDDLYLYKYKQKVFYDQLWNESEKLVDARGMVVNEAGDIVINPLTKIFHPNETPDSFINPYETVTAIEKINGFMCSLSFYNGKHIFATTGSLDSPFIELIKKEWYSRISPNNLDKLFEIGLLDKNYTYSFEIVSLTDPHIIVENYGIYLLSARENTLHSITVNEEYLDELQINLVWYVDIKRPNHFMVSYEDIVKLNDFREIEGYVVKGKNTTLKMKSPYYSFLKYMVRGKRSYQHFDRINKIPWIQYQKVVDILVETIDIDDWKSYNEQNKLNILRQIIGDDIE